MSHPLTILPIMLRAARPSRIADMPAVQLSFWLKPGYEALTFFGTILTATQREADQMNRRLDYLKNHELIHLRQAQACGDSWLRFYCQYLRFWLQARRANSHLPNAGYLLNPFELEAYEHQHDLDYLATCPQGATGWKRYQAMTLAQRYRAYRKSKKYRRNEHFNT